MDRSQSKGRNALLHDILEATAQHNEARDEFEVLMSQVPSGLPHPDGVQRIKNASTKLSIARDELMKAHSRLDGYLAGGIVPEDLQRNS